MIDLGEFSEFIRIELGDPVEIQVAKITWDGPHESYTEWKTFKHLPFDSSDETIDQAVQELLKNRRYFKKCDICSMIKHVDIMNNNIMIEDTEHKYVCHVCMAKNGIVF